VARTFLLDTNVLLAATIAPERLPAGVRDTLADAANAVYFSAASLWEIAIKRSLRNRNFDFQPQDIHQLALATGL
jgi:PIN domain nuclease of toxin-antitoxin system